MKHFATNQGYAKKLSSQRKYLICPLPDMGKKKGSVWKQSKGRHYISQSEALLNMSSHWPMVCKLLRMLVCVYAMGHIQEIK